MKSLPVIAVVVLATATLSLTSVPLAAGSAIPIKRTTLHVRDVSEADSRAPRELRGEQMISPVCGNGNQEEGEFCDCGSPEECMDPCCNATTCQFRSYGTPCRAASGQCDIEEYCSGYSSVCPDDTILQDGSSCNNNTAYCYDGVCQTYDDQCRFHFATSKGSDVCYSIYNTRGDQFGNCGHTASRFIPCSTSDVQCGQLHCVVGDYQQTADVFVTILTVSAFNPSTFSVDRCRSFTNQPGSNEMSLGLVRNGTKCGNDKLCLHQRCVSRSNLDVSACPSGSNGLICSGNGKCNNYGQCSCDVGFGGGSCQSAVPGDANECNTNNGGCAQFCTNTSGSEVCSCTSGFTLDSDGRNCHDINECNTNNGGCTHICTNTQGSRVCNCTPGFTLASDGRNCQDINECNTNNGGCTHICTNTQRSRVCSCRTGFTLASDGRNCQDFNECSTNNRGCAHNCTNTLGSRVCSYSSGYTLANNGRSCIANIVCGISSINERCAQICTNVQGSRVCSCRAGFTLASDGRNCQAVCEPVCLNGGVCIRPGYCSCPEGYVGSRCEEGEPYTSCV